MLRTPHRSHSCSASYFMHAQISTLQRPWKSFISLDNMLQLPSNSFGFVYDRVLSARTVELIEVRHAYLIFPHENNFV